MEKEMGFIKDLKVEDYNQLNVKCGLEIHQQLNTKKLFCNSESIEREEKISLYEYDLFRLPTGDSIRFLRASAGEHGKIDISARYEQKREKFFLYRFKPQNSCLVELDEEPPHNVNKEALEIAIKTSLLLNMNIINLISPMRKIVIDGSNTTGFQRTMLVSYDGYLNIGNKNIGIETLCLEEDAARIIKRCERYDIYGLDRLGIPLIEIVTKADIKNSKELKKTAESIGLLLRSFKEVKRGIGTIRQDINISIFGKNRVEIKGAQDLKALEKIMENEIIRQYNLYKFKEYVEKNIKKEEIKAKAIDITPLFRRTKCRFILNALKENKKVIGSRVINFSGLIGLEVYSKKRIGTELSDYIKVVRGVSGLIHSDELPAYGITQEEVDEIKKKLKCSKMDAFILVVDKHDRATKALKDAVFRLKQICHEGVTKDVRKANNDFTTSFLRPMPSSARMYPETDVDYIYIDDKKIKELRKELPKTIKEKVESLKKYNLNKKIIMKLIKLGIDIGHYIQRFDNLKPSYIADIFLSISSEIKRVSGEEYIPPLDHIEKVLDALNKNKITKENIAEILYKARSKNINDVIRSYKLITKEELIKKIKSIIKKEKLTKENKKKAINLVMKELRGKASGRLIIEVLERLLR